MYKLAIIGASSGQQPLYTAAREMGIYTIGFAWPNGAICADMCSEFYPISIMEMDKIVDICRKLGVNGVVSNASDLTARVVSYVSDKLNLGGDYDAFINAQNKLYSRNIANNIPGLTPVRVARVTSVSDMFFPCVIKPCVGHSKHGVQFIKNIDDAQSALEYALTASNDVMIEEFINAPREISVESISFRGTHMVIQITDKETTGAPHFVETGHHQPANLSANMRQKIVDVIPKILDAYGYKNGASHIEMKFNPQTNDLYLIEANLRGGGDNISAKLVKLSTNYDYIRAMIQVALGTFCFPKMIHNAHYSGILYLCNQTRDKLESFQNISDVVEKHITQLADTDSKTNYDRAGYIIYCADKKISL